MSAQPSHVTTLETIEHLDFEHEPPCERVIHQGPTPAIFVVRITNPCPCPPNPRLRLMCLPCWERAAVRGLYCRTCGSTYSRDDSWQIVRVIGGTS